MLRRLATSSIIALATGCGGPLDVGGVASDDAGEHLGGETGSTDGGTSNANVHLAQLNKAIEGDWYFLVLDPLPLGGPPQDYKIKLHLESRGAYFGKAETTCIGPVCQDPSTLGADGGSGSVPSLAELLSNAPREYWLLKADSESKGIGVITTLDNAVTFRVDMTSKPVATLTASFFLEGKFLRKPPPGFYDGGSP